MLSLDRLFIARWASLALLLLGLSGRAEVKVGDPFPPLLRNQLVLLGGTEIPAFDGRVTLIDFWASWCAPCKASFPALGKLQVEFGPRGFQVLAISLDEKPAAAAAFWKKMAPPFTGLHDARQELVRQVVVPAMPTSYLVGPDGRIRSVHAGFRGDVSQLRKEIEALLPPNT